MDKYREDYVNEAEGPEPELDAELWEDWSEDDEEYYDNLCKEFPFLMENNL